MSYMREVSPQEQQTYWHAGVGVWHGIKSLDSFLIQEGIPIN